VEHPGLVWNGPLALCEDESLFDGTIRELNHYRWRKQRVVLT